MAQGTQKGRPADDPSTHNNPDPSVVLATDDWSVIRRGWVNGGDTMPRPGSLAWRALPDDDPVKLGVAAAEALEAGTSVRRHGPTYAKAEAA